ncbi:glycosyltransferase family 2 protein [bacterium]|nr:MAG: glycosyltransferase family 2 protein [bacterium]
MPPVSSALVSICIPAFNRPSLLVECVRAALGQSYENVEVLIGDDSRDDSSEVALREAGLLERVGYERHSPSLGQARNVNRLLERARGERIVLIHDDDWLLPDAVRDLDLAWHGTKNTQVCFGLQAVADANGKVSDEATAKLNAEYGRVPSRFGVQKEPRWSALMGQIPNNGWMVETALAQLVSYSDSEEVSHACDFDFGLRLAQKSVKSGGAWVLCEQIVSVVRLSDNSILRSAGPRTNYSDATWNLIEKYELPPEGEVWRRDRLRRTALGAVKKWLSQGQNLRAARAYFSGNFPPRRRLSKRGMMLGAMLFLPLALNRLLLRKL